MHCTKNEKSLELSLFFLAIVSNLGTISLPLLELSLEYAGQKYAPSLLFFFERV